MACDCKKGFADLNAALEEIGGRKGLVPCKCRNCERWCVAGKHLNDSYPVFDFDFVTVKTLIDNQGDLSELIDRLEKIREFLPLESRYQCDAKSSPA